MVEDKEEGGDAQVKWSSEDANGMVRAPDRLLWLPSAILTSLCTGNNQCLTDPVTPNLRLAQKDNETGMENIHL